MAAAGSDSAQEVRAVLAKWTANDWRHAFALAPGLDGALRAACEVPAHEPLASSTGALAMPVLTRLGQLGLDPLVGALTPLSTRLEARLRDALAGAGGDLPAALDALEAQAGVGPGLARLAALRLVRHSEPPALAAARRILEEVEAGLPAREDDLRALRDWNDGFDGSAALQALADAPVSDGARPVLAAALGEATADPVTLSPERRQALLALHRLLGQQPWDVDDGDVEAVERAFGRQVARVAVAEVVSP